MSQPFVVVAIRNTGEHACYVRGYPTVALYGHQTHRTSHWLAVRNRDGAIYERKDLGPHQVVLRPGGVGSFSAGTGTAYQGGLHLYTVTELGVTLPGETRRLVLGKPPYAASAPRHARIPVGVTAIRKGITP